MNGNPKKEPFINSLLIKSKLKVSALNLKLKQVAQWQLQQSRIQCQIKALLSTIIFELNQFGEILELDLSNKNLMVHISHLEHF